MINSSIHDYIEVLQYLQIFTRLHEPVTTEILNVYLSALFDYQFFSVRMVWES